MERAHNDVYVFAFEVGWLAFAESGVDDAEYGEMRYRYVYGIAA